MTRSKIFLGITASVLAVAAIAANKATKFSRQVKAYYSHGNTAAKCTLSNGSTLYFTKADGTQAFNANGAPLYSFNSGKCKSPLYTNNIGD